MRAPTNRRQTLSHMFDDIVTALKGPHELRKSHRENTVGPWAEQKLDALESYMKAYMNVMKNQPFRLVCWSIEDPQFRGWG